MTDPVVSVVVPTRDRADRLALALRSALAQRDVAVEVVVVDDASTDGTPALLGRLGDGRVRTVRHASSLGVGASRNRGIAEARGEWIAFLDDDDLWAPEKLRRQLEAVRASGRRWAYGGEVTVDADLRVLGGSPPPPPERVVADLERYDAVPGGSSGVLVAAETLERLGGFDPHLSTSEDWDLWIRLARDGPPAVVSAPVVALWDRPGRSASMPRMLEELQVVGRRHGVRVDWPRHFRWAAWEALRDGRRATAARYYAAAARRGDLASIPRAAVALTAPGMARRAGRPQGSTAWVTEAEGWLRPLAAARGVPPP